MIELKHADAYDYIKTVRDKSIDLVIIDPPYIIDDNGGGGTFGSKNRDYLKDIDNMQANFKKGFDFSILSEIKRVSKSLNIYIFCNKNLLAKLLKHYHDYNFDILVWHKKNPSPLCNNKYLSDLEYILFVREKGVKVFGDYHSLSKMISTNVYRNSFNHPTVKPIQIIQRILNNSSEQDDVILDVFAGTGTTAVVCQQNNRNFKGCEIEKKYFEIAVERLSKIQQNLF